MHYKITNVTVQKQTGNFRVPPRNKMLQCTDHLHNWQKHKDWWYEKNEFFWQIIKRAVKTAQRERYITPSRRTVTAVQYTVPCNRAHNRRLVSRDAGKNEQNSLPFHRFHQKLVNSDTTEEANNNAYAIDLKLFGRSSAISCRTQLAVYTISSILHSHKNSCNMSEADESLHQKTACQRSKAHCSPVR